MRAVFAIALAALVGGCDLLGDGCPPASFGLECAMIGEWDLDTVDGQRASGVLEVQSGFDGFLSVPSGSEDCGAFRGPLGGSAPNGDVSEGAITVRVWQVSSGCGRYSVDLNGRAALDGDRLTLTLVQDRVLGDGTFPLFREPSVLVFSR